MDSVYLASGGARLEVNKQRALINESNRKLDIEQQGANDSSRRSYQEELASQQNLEANKFDLLLKQQQEARRKREASLAEMVFKNNKSARLSAEGEDDTLDLYKQNLEMAKSLASVDPEASNKYFKAAYDFKRQAAQSAEDSLTLRGKKLEAKGDIASTVIDPESLRLATIEMAKLGTKVPEEVQDWSNPKTKEWWERQAQFSPAAVKANQLALDKKKFDSVYEDRLADNTREDTKLKLKEKDLEAKRNAIVSARKKVVSPTKDELKTTANSMKAKYENFDNAPSEVQTSAASDVKSMTLQIMQDENMSQQQAKEKAERLVASMISEDGVYNVPTNGSEKKTANNSIASPKTQVEFNALPSGTLYINPKDGKQYRKK